MDEPKNRIHKLLSRLKTKNEQDSDCKEQVIHAPELKMDQIATLQSGTFRSLSPMLSARFTFAGTWTQARLGQNWLSLTEIENALVNESISKQIKLRSENNYGEEPPGNVEPQNCAIFSLNPFELDETYLVWKEGQEEPVVWEYFAAEDNVFLNFEHYLEYIVGDRLEDDKRRLHAIWVRVISSENKLLQVSAIKLSSNFFKIISRIEGENFTTQQQDSRPLKLEFSEGDTVRCEIRHISDSETGLLAVEKVTF